MCYFALFSDFRVVWLKRKKKKNSIFSIRPMLSFKHPDLQESVIKYTHKLSFRVMDLLIILLTSEINCFPYSIKKIGPCDSVDYRPVEWKAETEMFYFCSLSPFLFLYIPRQRLKAFKWNYNGDSFSVSNSFSGISDGFPDCSGQFCVTYNAWKAQPVFHLQQINYILGENEIVDRLPCFTVDWLTRSKTPNGTEKCFAVNLLRITFKWHLGAVVKGAIGNHSLPDRSPLSWSTLL